MSDSGKQLLVAILLTFLFMVVIAVALVGLNSLMHPPQPVEIVQLPTLSVIQP